MNNLRKQEDLHQFYHKEVLEMSDRLKHVELTLNNNGSGMKSKLEKHINEAKEFEAETRQKLNKLEIEQAQSKVYQKIILAGIGVILVAIVGEIITNIFI